MCILEFFLILMALLLFIFWRKRQNKQFYKKISQFNGPPTVPFLGNSLMLRGSPTESFRVLHKLLENYPNKCYVIWCFNHPYVMTGRREDVQVVFKMHHKGRLYDFFRDSLGSGLIVSNGEKWKKSRVLVESVLATNELSTNILHIFNEQSHKLIDEITQIGMGVDCNLWPLILRVNTRIISETTIGSAKRDDLDISQGYGTGNKRCEILIMKRMYSPWLYPEFMFRFYLFLSGQSHVFKAVRAPFLKAIKKRKEVALKKRTSADEASQSPRKLMLDALIESKYLTDEDLTDEIMTLMFAGSDTSATGICFTLLMLAMNPDVQEKVYEELNVVFREKNESIDISNLQKLTFLEQCIKETLRKFCVVPVIVRNATSDAKLSDGRVVPAGTNVILSIYEIHNNPEYYPNPQIWDPHNFDPDRVANRPINSFIPFASGSRMCVGYKYAMMSMKVLLAHVLLNFKVSTEQTEVKLNFNVLVKCVNGYHVKFEQRAKNKNV